MTKSDSIAALADALSKAQAEMTSAKKDMANPFFKSKYADLASVREAIREPFGKYGLAVSQMPETKDGQVIVHSLLMHSSGEWVTTELTMTPVKSDPQGVGSCITYARRYALAAIAGIAPEDDDGNEASGVKQIERTKQSIPISRNPVTVAAPVQSDTSGKGVGTLPEKVADKPLEGPSPAGAQAPPMREPGEDDEELVGLTALWKAETETGSFVDEPIGLPKQRALHRAFVDAIPDTAAETTRKQGPTIFREWLRNQGYVGDDGQGSTKKIPEFMFDEVRKNAVEFARKLK